MHTHTLPPRQAILPRTAAPCDRETDNTERFRHRWSQRAATAEMLPACYDLGPVKQMQRDRLASVLIVAATLGACYALVYLFA